VIETFVELRLPTLCMNEKASGWWFNTLR